MRNRKQLWYGLALGVLGVALVADRVFFASTGQPESAEATVNDYADPVDAEGHPIELLAVEVAPFPDVAAEDARAVRDPFTMTPLVHRMLVAEVDESQPQLTASSIPAITAEQFAANHQLSAVMQVDGQWRAIINGVLTAPGQRIDDCLIIGINERSVEVQCGQKRFRLIIQEPLDRK